MKTFRAGFWILAVGFCLRATASAGFPFIYDDGLAPRDEWGQLHQSPYVIPTDLEQRYSLRCHYYLQGASSLQKDPAYVAAAQTALQRLGYYCGEIDGVFGSETSDAIERLQKNYALRVTGNLNVAARRALHLP